MKKLMITAAALMMAVAAYGQGSFFFNTHDTSFGNNVQFTLNGTPASGSDLMMEVLAGPDLQHLTSLGTLPLNNTGAKAGYPNPLSQVFNNVTGDSTGKAVVEYRAFQGTSYDTATVKTDPISTVLGGNTPLSVALAVAPATPTEVLLGTGSVALVGVPEPGTLALGALGIGALLMIRRRK